MMHVLLVYNNHKRFVIADRERHFRNLCIGRVHPSRLSTVVHGPLDLFVDHPNDMWMRENNTRPGISDSTTSRTLESFISYSCVSSREIPESAPRVNIHPLNISPRPSRLVDKPERKETIGTQVDGEQMFRQQPELTHHFQGRSCGFWLYRIEMSERETQNTVRRTFKELVAGKRFRQLHCLLTDSDVSYLNVIPAYVAG